MIYQVNARFRGDTWEPIVDGVFDPVAFEMIFNRSAESIPAERIQDFLVLWCDANVDSGAVRVPPLWLHGEYCLAVELEIGSVAEYSAMGFDTETAGKLARKAQAIRRAARNTREVTL